MTICRCIDGVCQCLFFMAHCGEFFRRTAKKHPIWFTIGFFCLTGVAIGLLVFECPDFIPSYACPQSKHLVCGSTNATEILEMNELCSQSQKATQQLDWCSMMNCSQTTCAVYQQNCSNGSKASRGVCVDALPLPGTWCNETLSRIFFIIGSGILGFLGLVGIFLFLCEFFVCCQKCCSDSEWCAGTCVPNI